MSGYRPCILVSHYTPVILESPYAGDVDRNMRYLSACIQHSLLCAEAPFASHLMYTQALDDGDPRQREIGIKAGLAWGMLAVMVVVYEDLGISSGMQMGIDNALKNGKPLQYRKIGHGWDV